MSSLSIRGVNLRARVYLRTREMNISVVMDWLFCLSISARSALIFSANSFCLLLIPPRHSGETVIGEFAGNIVLIDPLEQAIQFLIAGLQAFSSFSFKHAI